MNESDERRQRTRLDCAFGYLTVSDEARGDSHQGQHERDLPRHEPSAPLRLAIWRLPDRCNARQLPGRTR